LGRPWRDHPPVRQENSQNVAAHPEYTLSRSPPSESVVNFTRRTGGAQANSDSLLIYKSFGEFKGVKEGGIALVKPRERPNVGGVACITMFNRYLVVQRIFIGGKEAPKSKNARIESTGIN